LKEADLANRRQRISIRQAGVILGVLTLYLVLAAMIFPRTRFFRRPITVVWGGTAITLLEPRTLDRLPQDIRDSLEEGRFTRARHLLDPTFSTEEGMPGVDHSLWAVFLFTLHQNQDPDLLNVTQDLLEKKPEMLEARFYGALHRIRNVERNRLTPAWYDGTTKSLIAEMNQNLRVAVSDLERVSQGLIPLGSRRTPAQNEMLRLCYHHKAEANYLLWLHDPDRPRVVTDPLTESFRYLNLADPGRQQAETVRLHKQIARSVEKLMDWGILKNRKLDLFGESRDLANLQKFIDELNSDYDRARSIQ